MRIKWSKPNNKKIDAEMVNFIHHLTDFYKVKVKACCCGHGKYHPSVVVGTAYSNFDFITGEHIPRKKRFYYKDKQGYYFIPEVEQFYIQLNEQK